MAETSDVDVSSTSEKGAEVPAQDENSQDVEVEAEAEPEPAQDVKHSRRKDISNLKWAFIMFNIFSGALLYGLDTTVAADVQGTILEAFGSIEKLPWVGIGFPMGSVAMILLIGKLYGTFEIKWLLVTCVVFFEAGSALCGAAPTMEALILGRVIAGMGGAGNYLGALNYIGVFCDEKKRPIYNAVVGLSWGIGAILGPVVGGAFSGTVHATWRWAFFINLPLFAIQFPLFVLFFPKHNPKPGMTLLQKVKTIDWLGAVLNAATFVLLIVSLTFSGSTWPWRSPGPIITWILLGVVVITYAVQQTTCFLTTPERRLFPVRFLKSRTMALLWLATANAGGSTGVTIYYIPILYQFTRGDSALKAAVRLMPFIVPYISFLLVSGGLLTVLGRYAPFYVFAGAMLCAGGAAMFTVLAPDAPERFTYAFEALIGLGAGFSFQTAYAVASHLVPHARLSDAIGFINVAQVGSSAVSLAIVGCIYQNVGMARLGSALAPFDLPQSAIDAALGGAASGMAMATPQERDAAVGAIVATIRDCFGIIMANGAIMLLAGLALKWERLDLRAGRSKADNEAAA